MPCAMVIAPEKVVDWCVDILFQNKSASETRSIPRILALAKEAERSKAMFLISDATFEDLSELTEMCEN